MNYFWLTMSYYFHSRVHPDDLAGPHGWCAVWPPHVPHQHPHHNHLPEHSTSHCVTIQKRQPWWDLQTSHCHHTNYSEGDFLRSDLKIVRQLSADNKKKNILLQETEHLISLVSMNPRNKMSETLKLEASCDLVPALERLHILIQYIQGIDCSLK